MSDSFRSQNDQKQHPPTKERDGIFSSIELQKSFVTKPVGSENKRPSGEKSGECILHTERNVTYFHVKMVL